MCYFLPLFNLVSLEGLVGENKTSLPDNQLVSLLYILWCLKYLARARKIKLPLNKKMMLILDWQNSVVPWSFKDVCARPDRQFPKPLNISDIPRILKAPISPFIVNTIPCTQTDKIVVPLQQWWWHVDHMTDSCLSVCLSVCLVVLIRHIYSAGA